MNLLFLTAVILALLVGLSLGVLGGGGTVLAVPLLTYVAGFGAKEAIAASMFIIGVTSAISVIAHARRGNVRWGTGLIFGAAGMAGAFGGGFLGGFLPGTVLLIAFALMMLMTAVAMIRKPRRPASAHAPVGNRPVVRILLDGAVVGLVTGLVGAGGGFLIVPALVLLGGLPMPLAVGTSLLVIAMKSFTGFAGYLTHISLDWPPMLAFTAVTVAGSLLGTALAGRVPEAALKKGFGYFVLIMGVVVLIQELPGLLALVPLAITVVAAAVLAVCRFTSVRCPFAGQTSAA